MPDLDYAFRRRSSNALLRRILADGEAVALELEGAAHNLQALSVLTQARICLPRAERHADECSTAALRLRTLLDPVYEDIGRLLKRFSMLSLQLAEVRQTQQEEIAETEQLERERRDKTATVERREERTGGEGP